MPSSLVRLEDRLVAALLVHELGLAEPPRLSRRYRILGIRGRGARGLVCRAVDERLEREVAIKLYADIDPLRDEEVDTEARALARLDHPNVVRVYDVGRDSLVLSGEAIEVSFLVMELVDGRSLRTYLGSAQRSHEALLKMLADVASALEAAHARGLAHRDVKPENVMLDATGRVRVVDFGLSRYSKKPSGDGDEADTQEAFATTRGKLVGTVEYMAPEARTGLADARSDQFSFAMMAWECLTGVLPFDGRSGHWRPDDATRFDGHEAVDPALRPVLEKALSIEPSQRHDSMSALREAFLPDHFGTKLAIGAGVAVAFAIGLGVALGGVGGVDGSVAATPDARTQARFVDASSAPDVRDASVEVSLDANVDSTASVDCAVAVGHWELDTVVVDSRLRAVPAGTHAYFIMDVDPLAPCDALVRLTKIGDESAAEADAGPYFAAEEIRDDEARVALRATDAGVELEQRFGLASPSRPRRDYEIAIRFHRGRIAGDLRYLSASGTLAYRAEIRGGRRRSPTPIVASVATLPCGSKCRLSCRNDPAIISECTEACGRGETLAVCALDAGVSRSEPSGERLEERP